MFNKLKGKMKAAFYTSLSAILLLPVQAQDLAGTMGGLTDAAKEGTVLIFVASALIGIALMIAGGIQLKKYADNPQQNGIAKPMIYILAGVIIFGVSATSDTMEQTLFGDTGSEKGMDFDELK